MKRECKQQKTHEFEIHYSHSATNKHGTIHTMEHKCSNKFSILQHRILAPVYAQEDNAIHVERLDQVFYHPYNKISEHQEAKGVVHQQV